MALNNSQYDTIMRDYQRRQNQHRREQGERISRAFSEFPRLRGIDEEIASASVACARKLLGGDEQAVSGLKEEIARLGDERISILTAAGYPADYLEITYTCPDCRDTGYRDGRKCRCFKKAEIDLLYTQSNLKGILEQENFDRFDFRYYSAEITDASGRVSSLDRIRRVYDICRDFIQNFDSRSDNLFFYGDTGVGKTFLSHCIAKELLDTTHSVIYFSAQELFAQFAKDRFSRDTEDAGESEHIYDCDLLIIDDLGTELTNAFVNAELFTCINERLINRRSTIISTNLTLDALSNQYSERVFSRISNGYTLLKLFGEDIRVQKKVQRLSGKKT